MGGRNGFTLADYAALSDRQIIALLGIEWDEDGRLVCEGDEARDEDGEPTGSIRNAGRELQGPEQLGLSEEDFRWAMSIRPMVGTFFFSMFWSVWQKRGKSNDEIKKLWLEHLMSDR